MTSIQTDLSYVTFALAKTLQDGSVLLAHEAMTPVFDFTDNTSHIKVFSWPDKAAADNREHPTEVSLLVSKHTSYDMLLFQRLSEIIEVHPLWSLASIAPSPTCVWNFSSLSWEETISIEDRRLAKWTEIKTARSQAEYAGFTWDGSVFDSDARSQQRITGAVTLAQMDDTFSIGWTLKNNTVRQLNASEMMVVGTTLGVYVAAQFAHAQDLRVQLEAAVTMQGVDLISW
jgi:hypothetical protein